MATGNEHVYGLTSSYGMIGDCRSAALVASDGAVNWGCLPDFDSPPIFCRLMDAERGGYFQIAPADVAAPGSQRYLRGSNVVQTIFTGRAGTVVLIDFMPVETLNTSSQEPSQQNTGDNGNAHQCLVRSVECTDGELPLIMTLKVTLNDAVPSHAISLLEGDKGAIISSENQHVGLAIVGAYRVSSFSMCVLQDDVEQQPAVVAQITLREGERIHFALAIRDSVQAAHRMVEDEMLQRNFDWELAHTLHCWRSWVTHRRCQGPYLDWIQRSILTLKLLKIDCPL